MTGWLRSQDILQGEYLVGGDFSSATISFTVVVFFLGMGTFVLRLSSSSSNSWNDTDTGLDLGEKLFLEKYNKSRSYSTINTKF